MPIVLGRYCVDTWNLKHSMEILEVLISWTDVWYNTRQRRYSWFFDRSEESSQNCNNTNDKFWCEM